MMMRLAANVIAAAIGAFCFIAAISLATSFVMMEPRFLWDNAPGRLLIVIIVAWWGWEAYRDPPFPLKGDRND